MERFLEEIKDNVCLDYDLEELRDIHEATEKLLMKLSKSIVKVNPLFEVGKLVPCGSMVEKTRNWKFTGKNREPVVEFDFLAILKSPPQEEVSISNKCDGFMQIIDRNEHLKHFCNKFAGADAQKSLLGDRMSFSFQIDLLKSINYLCACFTFDMKMQTFKKDDCCKYVVQGTVHQKGTGCDNCTEYNKSGFLQIATGDEVGSPYYNHSTLVFKWTSASCTLKAPNLVNFDGKYCLRNLHILVDFLPSFEILKMSSSELKNDSANQTVLGLEHDCYLVPKTCTTGHDSCWKVSNCAREIDVIKAASQEHRFAYMILKFMSDCLFSSYFDDGSLPTTYRIKTAVLQHIKYCSESKLSACVKQLLIDLSNSFIHQSLPNFVNGFNLLSVKKLQSDSKRDILSIQNKTWHKNRCTIIGECYMLVSELFKDSRNLVLNLKSGVGLLKYIGKAYHDAWSVTEYQCVYGVCREKLLAVTEEELTEGEPLTDLKKGLVIRRDVSDVHWTKSIGVWEYENVRKLYGRYHLEYPDPPGRTPGREENIYLEAKKFSGYYEWERKDQDEWITKLENSGSPNDIVTALKSVNIYYFDEKAK